MNLLLVGAGQLGSRHLQSCLKYPSPMDFYVVDNSLVSLEISKNRALEIPSHVNHKLHFCRTFDDVTESVFDFLIIATGASPRLTILKAALKKFTFSYVILEKVLFQTPDDYKEASDLIEQSQAKVYVNCPRRVYPFYKELKRLYIDEGSETTLSCQAGDWIGLGCNSIHYLDLLNFLTDRQLVSISTEKLDKHIIDSKRPGYKEFTGLLSGCYKDGAKISIESIYQSDMKSTLSIQSGRFIIKIDELSGDYEVFENGESLKKSSYKVIYQSELTHKILEQLVDIGECELTSFEDSKNTHLVFLNEMLDFYNTLLNEKAYALPIT